MKKLNTFLSFLVAFTLLFGSFHTTAFAQENKEESVTVIGSKETLVDLNAVADAEGSSAFDALVKAVGEANIEFTESQYGKMITSIQGVKAEGTFFWAFYVNGVGAQVGADSYILQDGDQLSFVYQDWTVATNNKAFLTVNGKEATPLKEATDVGFINNPTALDLLTVVLGHDKLETSVSEYGIMINGISGIAAEGTYYWAFYVNGEMASVGADSYKLKAGDQITFKYESWESATEKETTEDTVETPATPFDKNALGASVETAVAYVLANQVGEWEAIALKQAGKTVPASYLENVKTLVNEKQGKFARITDTERYALGILAAGENPTAFEGYNLIEAIYNGNVTKQGLNGVVYGLLALDSANFEVPANATWTREKLVNHLLENQNEDGGWSWDGSAKSDIDTTAMVLTALAGYQDQAEVKVHIDIAVEFLSAQYLAGKIDNSSTAAQVVIALSALGVDANGELFAKDRSSLIGFLLSFQNADGGFDWQGGDESDVFSTAQGFQAIVAYQLFVKGAGSLYSLPLSAADATPVVEEKDAPAAQGDGKPLPNTATDMYNYLTFGIILLLAGIALYVNERRRRTS
ncbi:DUF4430 domain-containing protein [Bacillus luteolus]|uniref:DUF4430 domain-containing protein n=1 Tax=Litchfieldia luteola TaxID=682179 RepID=A0ABR9QF86_9BACI|nr:DUF4430 domain-containing protein [Cytobacillus luteolus]MBE4907138.1 DUF4430 domain-containing protein [Cytobacillus luteolus]MBP1943392.1 hypothetical protein [Cytobacillus luteolus]